MVMQNNSTDEPISLEFQWQKRVGVCKYWRGSFPIAKEFWILL